MTTDLKLPEHEIQKLTYLLRKYRQKKFQTVDPNYKAYHDKDGFDAFSAFVVESTQGEPVFTKHPRVLTALNIANASVNDIIKAVAKDSNNGFLSNCQIDDYCNRIGLPNWARVQIYRLKRENWGEYGAN